MPQRLKVLLADSRELLRRGIRSTLERSSEFEIIGEVASGNDAFELLNHQQPNIGIVGFVPSLSIMINRLRLKAELDPFPDMRFLIVGSESSSPRMLDDVPPAKARYLSPHASSDTLLRSVRALSSSEGSSTPRLDAEDSSEASSLLTPRELDVLHGIAEGRRTWEIAEQLGISRKTVETHRGALMRKLKLHRIADVVRYALRTRFIDA